MMTTEAVIIICCLELDLLLESVFLFVKPLTSSVSSTAIFAKPNAQTKEMNSTVVGVK